MEGSQGLTGAATPARAEKKGQPLKVQRTSGAPSATVGVFHGSKTAFEHGLGMLYQRIGA